MHFLIFTVLFLQFFQDIAQRLILTVGLYNTMMQFHAARNFPNAMPSTSPQMHINVRLYKLLYFEALVNIYFVDYLPSCVNLKTNTTLKKEIHTT